MRTSIALEAFEAEQFQPMRMWLAVEQFCGTFAYTFRSVATLETAVVEKKTQQVQIVVTDMSPQEEIVP